VLGSDAAGLFSDVLDAQRAELETWRATSESTDFS
jgi:hypothetical protein